MTQSIVRQSDLVLSVVGGVRHGKTISISTAKCVLAFDDDSPGANGQIRCAIMRGKAGVTIRNLDKKVSFNGHFSPTHWLKEGDLIQFPNSVALRVTHLGSFEEEAASSLESEHFSTPEGSQIEYQSNEFPQNSAPSSLSESLDHGSTRFDKQTEFVNQSRSFEHENVESFRQSSIEPVEVKRITDLVDTRFGEIEKRIEMLTEQISSLVTLATSGQVSTNKLNEDEWRSYSKPQPELHSEQQQEKSFQSDYSFGTNRLETQSETIESENSEDRGFQSAQSTYSQFNADSSLVFGKTHEFENAARFEQPTLDRETSGETSATEGFSEIASEPAWDAAKENPGEGSFLTPVRRSENQDAQQSTASPTDFETIGSQPDLNPEPPQSGFGQFSSFRAATNALDQFQTNDSMSKGFESVASSNSHSFSQHESEPEVQAPDSAQASASTDEALDAMLKRLYQNQNVSDPAEGAADSSLGQTGTEDRLSSSSEVESNAEMSGASGLNAAANQFSRVAFEPEAESTPSPTNPKETETSSGSTAIMDLLAKLKAEGAWGEAENDSSSQSTQLPESTPNQFDEPSQLPQSSQLASLFIEPESEIIEHPAPAPFAREEEREVPDEIEEEVEEEVLEEIPVSADSVEDYMSQLLARMQKKRGDSDPPVKRSVEREAKENQAKEGALEKSAGNELMTAEEYVPQQKAQKIHSFETMREIANSTARTAVAYSDLDRRRTRGYMQAIITVGALIMALYYFLFLSKESGDTSSFVGCICLAISIGAGYFAFRTLTGLKNLGKNLSQ